MIRIFLLTCKANDKRFIGATHFKHNLSRVKHRLDTDSRRFAHLNNSPLYSDVISYGINAFTFSDIETCHPDQRKLRLDYWIAYFDTLEPKGYNRPAFDAED